MIWYVAAGSAAGGVARWLLGTFVQQRVGGVFPAGTMLVNITGSLLLGFLLRYALQTPAVSPEVRALLATGFCGGYTTFSTFSYETAALLEDGDYRRAALYALASVVLSLVGTYLGFALARTVLDIRRGG
ncbi:MAG TPA: fluoride efflux transporter CrcB [Gemmatimonadaceae bacterium]|nr:fluoride efflux transporter CrcB [Gemmatimonadaceae bacterium]